MSALPATDLPAGLRRREWLVAVLAALAGCGGVDSGGTGTGTPGQATLSVGTIAGFGSVIVNGVRYDESQAEIGDDDDRRLVRADLRLGMRAAVLASAIMVDAGVARAVASSVRLRSELGGPIEQVDRASRRLTVLGQRVDWSAATVIDGGAAALAEGMVVWVWGTRDVAAGRIVATRIEPRAAAPFHKIRGTVTALDLDAGRLSIGSLVVDWRAAAPEDPARTLAAGRSVHLRLVPAAGGVRTALAIVGESGLPADRDEAEIEGRITRFASARAFDVDGIPVDASAAAFPDGTAGLGLGTRVEVEGRLEAGVLVARTVKVEDEDDDGGGEIEVHGTIDAVDAGTRRFVVRGTTIAWTDATRFDSSDAGDIAVGRAVEVRGRLADDGATVEATLVHVET